MPILKVHSSQSYFFIPKGKSSSSDGFSTYSEANFKQKIDSYVKAQAVSFDVYQRVRDATFTDLTELHRSIAKIKVLIVITKYPLDETKLKDMSVSQYREDIDIFNFAMESSDIERTEGPLSLQPRVGRMTFGFDEVNALLKSVKEKKTKQICL